MGSARAPRRSPPHRETGHPAMACSAGKVRPQPPPRPGAGQGGIPGQRSNRHPAAAPEPAGRAGNESPEWHHPPREGCSGTRWGHTAPHNPPAPPGRRCLPPDTEAAYRAMAKGKDDLKRRRKNKAGQPKEPQHMEKAPRSLSRVTPPAGSASALRSLSREIPRGSARSSKPGRSEVCRGAQHGHSPSPRGSWAAHWGGHR